MKAFSLQLLVFCAVVLTTASAKTAKFNDSSVNTFKSVFAEKVLTSSLMAELFNVGQEMTSEDLADGIFYSCLSYSYDGAPTPPCDQYYTKYIAADFRQPTHSALVSLWSGWLAKFLKSEGVLTENNAQDLINGLAVSLENQSHVFMDHNFPRSKVSVLACGTEAFLQSRGLMMDEKAVRMRVALRDEWVYTALKHTDGPRETSSHHCPRTPRPERKEKFILNHDESRCFSTPPAVVIFKRAFADKILSSKTLSTVFDLKDCFTPVEFSRAFNYMLQVSYMKLGSELAAPFAAFAVRKIVEFRNLGLPTMVRFIGGFTGKFLHARGVLSEFNARKEGEEFGDMALMKTDAAFSESVPRSKEMAIAMTIDAFLRSHKVFTADTIQEYSNFFGNEAFCEVIYQSSEKCIGDKSERRREMAENSVKH